MIRVHRWKGVPHSGAAAQHEGRCSALCQGEYPVWKDSQDPESDSTLGTRGWGKRNEEQQVCRMQPDPDHVEDMDDMLLAQMSRLAPRWEVCTGYMPEMWYLTVLCGLCGLVLWVESPQGGNGGDGTTVGNSPVKLQQQEKHQSGRARQVVSPWRKEISKPTWDSEGELQKRALNQSGFWIPGDPGDTKRKSSWEAPNSEQSIAHRQDCIYARKRDLPSNPRLAKYLKEPSYLIPWNKLWSEQEERGTPSAQRFCSRCAVRRASPFLFVEGIFTHFMLSFEKTYSCTVCRHAACGTGAVSSC